MAHPWCRHGLRAAAVFVAVSVACAPLAAAQEAALAQRLSQIEEQIVDLQVAIATLQSFRGQVTDMAAQSSPFGDADMGSRVDAMETQIRALTGQIEHLGAQVAALHAQLGGGQDGRPAGPPADMRGQAAPPPHSLAGTPEQPPEPQPHSPQFGTTSVLPWAAQATPQSGDRLAALPGGEARDLYEDAYGHLLARDYESAEFGFRRFLDAFPDGELAGDAHYWLGETHFVRGQYKRAADAFLQSYRRAGGGSKAPDSLLKLGMSLNQIGERDAACDTFGELAKNFPDAPEHVRQRAAMEGRRAGC